MTLSEIQEEAKSLITYDNVPGSLEFAEKLEKSLIENNIRETHPDVYQEISKIIFQLYVTAIPNVPDEILFNIISFNLIEALSPIWPSERDLASRIESKYSIYPIELIKEMMRKDILVLVEKNTQQIGTVTLRLSQDNPEATPNIGNWIEYYNRFIGLEKSNSFIKSKFLSSDNVVQTITPEEKENLRKVLSFYDYLHTDETVLYRDIYNEQSEQYVSATNSESILEKNMSTSLNSSQVNLNQPPTPNLSVPSINPTSSNIDVANNIPAVSSKPIHKVPVPATSSAPIVLTPKPIPKPKNVINLKKSD
jgi:hypothetical protein